MGTDHAAAAAGEEEEEEEDPEVAALQERIQQEMSKISAFQKQLQGATSGAPAASVPPVAALTTSNVGSAAPAGAPSTANKQDVDSRSVYVGQVDYYSTAAELQAHFQSCGTINRVTIAADRVTNHPRGYAYIEFDDEASVANAVLLNDSVFKGRPLKVMPKRTNIPAFARGRGRGLPPAAAAGGGGRGMGSPMRARGLGPWRGAPRMRPPRGYAGYGYF
jgi:polyadenylate-binding protein 2